MLQPPLTVEKLLTLGDEFNEASIRALEGVYHPQVKFRDALQSLEGRDAFIDMNLRMIEKMDVSMEVLNTAGSPGCIFQSWNMHMTTRGRLQRTLSLNGATELVLDDEGVVVSHTDHWDLWGPVWDGTPLRGAYRWLTGKMG
ncbi:MAG: DUF2358 domain-containing protein [Thiohalobacterales bacterium]|nr:DUF2358 domain-containing protein [Thiohalobacterales bacterium]